MQRIRVIPVLLLKDDAMVKTRRFRRPRYLGDPINAVKIFNEKLADELVLLDIGATARNAIQFDWIEDIVSEAFMPVAYGGGIRTIDQAASLFTRGVEKVVINTAAIENPELLRGLAERFGSQAVVAAIDVRRNLLGKTRACIRNGRHATRWSPAELAKRCEDLGAGEILLTSIEREGTLTGYDVDLVRSVASAVSVPVIAHGGAASVSDFRRAVIDGRCSAVAASSMFVFATEGGGMLISYPSEAELEEQFWKRIA